MASHVVRRRLGDVLSERTGLSAKDIEGAILEQRRTTALLGEVLLGRGLVSKIDLVAALEEVTKFRYLDARFVDATEDLLKLVPRPVAERYCVMPVEKKGATMITVMAEPQNLRTVDELRFLSGLEISPRLGFRAEIQSAIETKYGESAARKAEAEQEQNALDRVDITDVQFFTLAENEGEVAEQIEAEAHQRGITPAVRVVGAMLSAAVSRRASDIHVEPQALATVVRIRQDGVMRELTRLVPELQNSLVSRLKILAGLDIAERRAPQDGRFLVQIGTRHIDVRVSTLPTHCGEKVVMRLLDPTSARVGFMDLGLSKENADLLAETLGLPQGMLLVTGPTGSGKSTTLYACLNTLRSPDITINTVEDPIEYQMEGISQVQINPKAGLTFAACLRSLLRQDPNVIMVGEIRDSETGNIALQAAQTGHFVMSTMHTNDSTAAVTRLLDLGVPGFMIASSVTLVIAQRLVRRLCQCASEAPITPEQQARLLAAGCLDYPRLARVPSGCDVCGNTGYKGRVGLYEFLHFDEALRGAVRGGLRDDDLRHLARSIGMRSIQEDGLDKVRRGLTSLTEVMRVVPFGRGAASKCRNCGKALAANYVACPYCATPVRTTGVSERLAIPAQGVGQA
jgi:type IV pilus assembly protein PilB